MRGVRWSALVLTVGALLSLALRFVLSDTYWPLNYNTYLPAFVYIGAALVLPWWLPARRICQAAAGVLLLVGGMVALHHEQPRIFRSNNAAAGKAANDGHIRLLTWNVQAYHGGMEEIISAIHEVDPDILCIVEGTFADRAPEDVRRSLGSEYKWAVGRRLSIASRIPIRESRQETILPSIWTFRAEFTPPDADPFSLLLVDVNPPFRRNETDVFEELRLLREMEPLPLIMTGDFNTPRQSRRLDKVSDSMVEALVEGGTERWLATWPTWLVPIWQVDYTFLTDEFQIERAEILKTTTSDHNGIIVDFIPPEWSGSRD